MWRARNHRRSGYSKRPHLLTVSFVEMLEMAGLGSKALILRTLSEESIHIR